MFNLLPNLFKDEIKSEYKLRKWIVILFFVLFIQLSFLAVAFSMLVVSSDRESEVMSQIKKENETLSSQNANDIQKIITSTNKKLLIFDMIMKYPEILPIYNGIIAQKTSDISIRGFNYAVGTTDTSIIVSGVSNTRESLVSFVKNLEETKMFTKVDLPVSNLAKQKNIEFNINIKIKN